VKGLLFWTCAGLTMVVSVAVSLVYFRLAMNLIPPAFLSQFNQAAAQSAFIFWGLGIGIVLLAIEAALFWLLPRLFQRKSMS